MTASTAKRLLRLGTMLIGSIALVQCGAASNATAPTTPVVVVVPPVVAAPSALSTISISASSVVGGTTVTGTALLTSPAPAGGAAVALTGDTTAFVPASVQIAAGSMSGSFAVTTKSVEATVTDTISGSYGGVSRSAVLSLTQQTVAIASFGVTGSTESDTCALSNGGNTLDCTFNGSTSTAPGTIVSWDWTFKAASTFAQATTGAVLSQPATNCSLLPSPAAPHEFAWFPLTVTLTVRDSLGNVSALATNPGARVFPNGNCGF